MAAYFIVGFEFERFDQILCTVVLASSWKCIMARCRLMTAVYKTGQKRTMHLKLISWS